MYITRHSQCYGVGMTTDQTPETREFTLAQVLTITTGRLLCPMGDVYEILDWLSGESLMTHQLPRVSREAEPWIFEQHPGLREVDITDVVIGDQADVDKLLSGFAVSYGSTLALTPMRTEDHTSIDAISELKMMRPDMPIIAVDPATGEARSL